MCMQIEDFEAYAVETGFCSPCVCVCVCACMYVCMCACVGAFVSMCVYAD